MRHDQAAAPAVLLGIVLGGAAVAAVGIAPHLPLAAFNDRRSFLNVYFVKAGWGWTSALLLPLALARFLAAPAPAAAAPRLAAALARWAAATLYWAVLTQPLLATPLFDAVAAATGTCSAPSNPAAAAAAAASPTACRRIGGSHSGVDVSGHCFLLIHSSLVIFEELRAVLVAASRSHPDRAPGPASPPAPLAAAAQIALHALPAALALLLALWCFMLAITALYFHSLAEKLLGCAFGLAFWLAFYVVIGPAAFPALLPDDGRSASAAPDAPDSKPPARPAKSAKSE
nr:fat storage-inducing transmembrane protein 2 [Polyrhizophydium stewartii]